MGPLFRLIMWIVRSIVEEEDAPEKAPARPPPKPLPEPVLRVRKDADERLGRPGLPPVRKMPQSERTPTDPALPADGAAASASPSGAAGMPSFVAALRGNPDAAKQGLVYAEIFGPPLADR